MIPLEGAGKGDAPRKDFDRKAYAETWIRCFGKECPQCRGIGRFAETRGKSEQDLTCDKCNGIGKVDPKDG